MDAFLGWLATINWNQLAKFFFENYEWLYALPYFIVIISTWSLLKNVGVKKWYMNFVLTLSVTISFLLYHQNHVNPTAIIDFELMTAIGKELMVASTIGLLTILVITSKGIYHLFNKNKTNVQEA